MTSLREDEVILWILSGWMSLLWWEREHTHTQDMDTRPPQDSHGQLPSIPKIETLGTAWFIAHTEQEQGCLYVRVRGVTRKVTDLCDLAKIPLGLIQHWNGPHSAMGRCLQHNEHKDQLWRYSLQGRKQRAPGTVQGFVGWNWEGSLLLQQACDKIHQRQFISQGAKC